MYNVVQIGLKPFVMLSKLHKNIHPKSVSPINVVLSQHIPPHVLNVYWCSGCTHFNRKIRRLNLSTFSAKCSSCFAFWMYVHSFVTACYTRPYVQRTNIMMTNVRVCSIMLPTYFRNDTTIMVKTISKRLKGANIPRWLDWISPGGGK